MKHTPKTKARIVERVCSLYESQNATLESCCQAAGISYPTFNLWCHADPVLGARFRKARRCQQANYWEEIIKPKAQAALERLLEGADLIVTKEINIIRNGMPTGQKIRTVTRSTGMPNVAALIFVLKGLYPEKFASRPISNFDIAAGQILSFEEVPQLPERSNGNRNADENDGGIPSNSGQSIALQSLLSSISFVHRQEGHHLTDYVKL